MTLSSGQPLLLTDLARTESTFEEIPIIDLSDASDPNISIRRALAYRIRDACINVGFFYVSNHGISDAVIDTTVNSAKSFFSLPLSIKTKLDIHNSPNYKGYTSLLGENTNPENHGDLHEGFDIGWEELHSSSESGRDDSIMSGQNLWPPGIPGFRESLLSYYHAAIALGRKLFPLFALALDLPETFFDDKTTGPGVIMRLLYYPPQIGPVDDQVQGIGAHTDYECFTLLWQDQVKALQVLNTKSKWVDATPIPGTLVVNIGDQFARWTNDIFKSTVHRAINRSGVERYSIPVFFGSDYNVKLEALPGCVSDDYIAKYEVVTAGEYVKSRLDATYAKSK